MHYQYSFPNKAFDRVLLRTRLKRKCKVFQKQIDNIMVLGYYDDLRVLYYHGSRFTSLIELKTTSKKYMWSHEIKAAVRQLQLYMWLMKEELERQGASLWKRSYVEVYSQRTGCLMKRIPVEYDDNIEDWIRHVVRVFQGLEQMSIPSYRVCKFCPKNVRQSCEWYKLMGYGKKRKRTKESY